MTKNKLIIQLNTILTSILLMSRLIIIIFYTGYGFFYITPFLYIIILLLFFVICLFNRKIPKFQCIAIFVISLYYFLGILNGSNDYSYIDIALYCFIPIFVITNKVNTEFLFKIIMCFSLFSIPVLDNLLSFQYTSLQQVDMSVAYALIFCITSACLHFLYYRKNKNFINGICYIYNIYLFFKILSVGNRGIYLVIACFLIFIQLLYVKNKEIKKNKRIIVWILLAIEFTILIVFALNLDTIILYLYDILLKRGVDIPSFIIKMRRQIIGDDILNGRTDLYVFFIKLIFSNPIGYGLSSAYAISKGLYAYPHNFVLQLCFELGVFGIVFSFFMIYPIYIILKKQNEINFDYKNLILFLLINTIPKCLISGDIWVQTQLWMMFSIGLMYFVTKKGEV